MPHPHPHKRTQVRILEISLFLAGLMATVLLLGCSQESGPPGVIAPNAANSDAIKQAQASAKANSNQNNDNKSRDNKDIVANKVTISGFDLILADDLLTANTNPFLNKAPIPIETAPAEGSDPNSPETVAVPVDPFDGIALTGIVYNPNNPIALLAIGDEVANNRQLIKKGQTFQNAGHDFQVVNMTKDQVEIKQADSKNIRTLYLPDIVGYGRSGSANTSSVANVISDSLNKGDSGKSIREKMETFTESEKLKPGESNKSILKLDEP